MLVVVTVAMVVVIFLYQPAYKLRLEKFSYETYTEDHVLHILFSVDINNPTDEEFRVDIHLEQEVTAYTWERIAHDKTLLSNEVFTAQFLIDEHAGVNLDKNFHIFVEERDNQEELLDTWAKAEES
jgi:hypothetical protein